MCHPRPVRSQSATTDPLHWTTQTGCGDGGQRQSLEKSQFVNPAVQLLILVHWHLAPQVLCSKPAAYLGSGFRHPPAVSPESHPAPGAFSLKAKTNSACGLAGFSQVTCQRGVDPCCSVWSICRPLPRCQGSPSPPPYSHEAWKNRNKFF